MTGSTHDIISAGAGTGTGTEEERTGIGGAEAGGAGAGAGAVELNAAFGKIGEDPGSTSDLIY